LVGTITLTFVFTWLIEVGANYDGIVKEVNPAGRIKRDFLPHKPEIDADGTD